MSDYLQHGRRHRPDGSDPIPGLAAGLPWMGYSNFSVSVGGAGTPVNILTTSGNFDFSDSSIFGDDGSGHPRIKAVGIYMLVANAFFSKGSIAPPALAAASINTNWGGFTEIGDVFQMFYKNQNSIWVAAPGTVAVMNITSVPDTQTQSLQQNSGVTISAQAAWSIVQLSPTSSSIL